MNKKSKEKNVRFSMVELFCIVIILGLILLMIFDRFFLLFGVNTSDSISMESIATKAAEDYYKKHQDSLPKNIGESSTISLKELKEKHYINDEDFISNKKNCMKYSYVRSYRLNDKECTYICYLYCGNETPDDSLIVPSPFIQISFSDEDGEKISSTDFEKVLDSRFMIEVNGGETRGGTLLAIDYYSFTIRVKTSSEERDKEYYSGLLYTNHYGHLKFMKKLSDYVRLDAATAITITVKAQNIVGGIQEVSLSSSLKH